MSANVIQERVHFPGVHGRLVGELAYPAGSVRYACLLVNPHPFMGGQMSNRLMERLAIGLAADGVTLRFDYAGVGESGGPRVDVVAGMARFWEEGAAPQDPGMLADAEYALHWMSNQVHLPLVLLGYSFGAHAAWRLTDEGVAAVVLISPTVTRHLFDTSRGTNVPKLIIWADDDFATPADKLAEWISKLTGPKEERRMPGGQHFFRHMEEEVALHCRNFLGRALAMKGAVSS